MPYDSNIEIDWREGCVFVQDGIIYCSPNSKRPVIIPPEPGHVVSPFEGKRLNASMFKQPVWWSDAFGWLSFIPLSPSFLSYPFENLYWIPRLHHTTTESDESMRYTMEEEDLNYWERAERNILWAANHLRLQHGIPGTSPPPPSIFNYSKPHRHPETFRTMVILARGWFTIWMGYLSYLIAQVSRPEYQRPLRSEDTNSPHPYWYKVLSMKGELISAWLDGLSSSTVLSFDSTTPRAGVIVRLAKPDDSRPSLRFFIDHRIPVYYPWSMSEDNATFLDRSFKGFEPPEAMVKSALEPILESSDSMMCLLIMQQYYGSMHNQDARKAFPLDWKQRPSFVTKIFYEYMRLEETITTEEDFPDIIKRMEEKMARKSSIDREAARLAANAPMQNAIGWLTESDRGSLYLDWKTFFEKRGKRNKEIMASENTEMIEYMKKCQNHPPPLDVSDIYQWKTVRSSRGKKIYLRVRVNRLSQNSAYSNCPKSQRVYDAISNEWDLCTDFKPPLDLVQGDDMDDDLDYGDPNDLSGFNESDGLHMEPYFSEELSALPSDADSLTSRAAVDSAYDGVHQPPQLPEMKSRPELFIVANLERQRPLQDGILLLKYGYGYVPALSAVNATILSSGNWKTVSRCFGFEVGGQEDQLGVADRECIQRFHAAMMATDDSQMPTELWDLNDANHLALSHLQDFSFIERPSSNMFIFKRPSTAAVDWLLGVESPEIALYVCRFALSNPHHTLLTIARHLLKTYIPFRTLVPLQLTSDFQTLHAPYTATSFRKADYVFTHLDFHASMIHSKAMVTQPRGRAALLKGGIISRIAREHTSLDGALDGPSIEIREHHVGFVFPAASNGSVYCDDELTEQELAVICGTYSIYTEIPGQITLKSWFPPASVWTSFNGYNWPGWTERNERFFVERLQEIEKGGQPLTTHKWKRVLRGAKVHRQLLDNNAQRAKNFLNKHLPVQVDGTR